MYRLILPGTADLYEVIKYHRERGSAMLHHVFKSAMYQLLAGVAYLHENWVLHRDLKPSNILLEQGRLKIAGEAAAAGFVFGASSTLCLQRLEMQAWCVWRAAGSASCGTRQGKL